MNEIIFLSYIINFRTYIQKYIFQVKINEFN